MSDEIKLLNQARTLRKVARDTRSYAEELSEAQYRQIVCAYADRLDSLAGELERLASVDPLTPEAWAAEFPIVAPAADRGVEPAGVEPAQGKHHAPKPSLTPRPPPS